jgi:hypothetical protein
MYTVLKISLKEEIVKKPNKIDLLLKVLADRKWHWGDELASEVTWRFGATIKEARSKGYPIETNQVGKRFRYRLLIC